MADVPGADDPGRFIDEPIPPILTPDTPGFGLGFGLIFALGAAKPLSGGRFGAGGNGLEWVG
jgi:hypothetical protein